MNIDTQHRLRRKRCNLLAQRGLGEGLLGLLIPRPTTPRALASLERLRRG